MRQIPVNISKTAGFSLRPKLLLITTKKLYMRFRLSPRSMTLDDIELYKFEFSEKFADFGRNNSYKNVHRVSKK